MSTDELYAVDDPFAAAMTYAASHGAENIRALPACWERQIDDGWFIAINGHDQDMTTNGAKGGGNTPRTVPPFSVHVEWYGWPAGTLTPREGWIAAGEAANVETFVAALAANAGAVLEERIKQR
jgi:hypothetical protein